MRTFRPRRQLPRPTSAGAAPSSSHAPDTAIEAVHVGKRFGGSVALADVSIGFKRGEIHALLGENGAGKTTLTRILAGVHAPDEGFVFVGGQRVQFSSPAQALEAGIGLIHQELSLIPGLTVGANVFLGSEPRTRRLTIRDREIRNATRALLDRLGASFSSDDLVGDLSVSDQQIVEIARVIAREPRVLIMDEPTAALAAESVERVFDLVRGLRDAKVAVIYISHELDEVFALADSVTVLKDGQITMSRPIAATDRREVVRMMVGRHLDELFPPRRAGPAGRPALSVERLTLPGHFENVSFVLHKGEVLGLAGLVGSGRSALAHTLFGAPPPPLASRDVRGSVRLEERELRVRTPRHAARLGIGLVPEERKTEGLLLERSVAENVTLPQLREISRWGVVRRDRQLAITSEQIAQLRIVTSSPFAPTRTLSGGNQQKVVLGKWLARDCSILLLDEPTRGVDIGAKTEIYELIRRLAERETAVLLISSSLPEVIGLSDRILVMSKGRIVSEHVTETTTEEELITAALGLSAEERGAGGG
jgi:ribose transport system ATP-binding protein